VVARLLQKFAQGLDGRCVATLRAATDRPLATAASFKDISSSLSSLMAWRWFGRKVCDGGVKRCLIPQVWRRIVRIEVRRIGQKGFMGGRQFRSRARARFWRRNRSMIRRFAMATSQGPNGRRGS